MDIKSTIDGNKEMTFTTLNIEGLSFDFKGNKELLKIVERSTDDKSFVVNLKGKKYEARVLRMDNTTKEVLLKLNGETITLKIEDQYDMLLKSMGMGAGAVKKINDMKAPMPGVVLEIKVKAGQEVAKDEAIVVLEAMKMENLLKSPVDGVIKSIEVEKGETVEKNRVLVNFE
ncbi:MAG: acetyl-CoA carboxylase biotin carboxyl carrier protein subunit [Flavobacteriales bacterium]|nr:acetyl-CoA carboxylase biotin carboxyl carrier protein subunit [Flavobacteriales bacterium]MCB9196390.1 acetyl-CoA carboxylase biotin carboxyl carrier protein subunit [Flavobacteriales bacterium]MCB9198442.1 acetyl-CoA carboxylase biotin carboxyl carrier protein subunit [Flavobacteriales bacterium]